MKGKLLSFKEIPGKLGIVTAYLDVRKLYPDLKEREGFMDRLRQFLDSDHDNPKIISLKGEVLVYKTECIIPEKMNSRPSLLLLLGNPASHSVTSEMFFSYEGNKREHRFWRALKQTGILSFKSLSNEERKEELYALNYDSPFRIVLATFLSMPSGASSSVWAGVAGLRKLFRMKGLRKLVEEERKRIEQTINKFLLPKSAVFAFQKDAYSEIKSSKSPHYDFDKVKKEGLEGVCNCNPNVRLFCLPPTRLMHGKNALDVLRKFRQRALD